MDGGHANCCALCPSASPCDLLLSEYVNVDFVENLAKIGFHCQCQWKQKIHSSPHRSLREISVRRTNSFFWVRFAIAIELIESPTRSSCMNEADMEMAAAAALDIMDIIIMIPIRMLAGLLLQRDGHHQQSRRRNTC